MFLFVILAAASLVAFLVSAVWLSTVGEWRPAFLYGNVFGRSLSALMAVPFFLTIGLTSLVAIPLVAVVVPITESWQEAERVISETWDTVVAVWDWFTFGAPVFITTGLE